MNRNPFGNKPFYINNQADICRHVAAIRKLEPDKALLLEKIAAQPQAIWLTDKESLSRLEKTFSVIEKMQALGIFVIYFIPDRDMGGYSKGGAVNEQEYIEWITEIARITGRRETVFILEPDALAHVAKINSYEAQVRFYLMKSAVKALKSGAHCAVYIDAGHPRWHGYKEMIIRLQRAGVDLADGFSLNVSNFITTEENIAYGKNIALGIGGKHFIIDTSRNGKGPKLNPDGSVQWCNPPGRALGNAPTARTGHPLVDAYLWIKRPGQSDGECNNGPKAGSFWEEYALDLIGNPPSLL